MSHSSGKNSLARVLIQIALAAYLLVTGLCMLGVGGSIKSFQVSKAVYALFSGDAATIVNAVLGVVLLVCSVVIVIKFFTDLGKFDNIIMLITLIVWICVAVIIDLFSSPLGVFHAADMGFNWLATILDIAKNLLIIGGLLAIHD